MAAVDYSIAQGYTDPDKLAALRWSYDGILTNYLTSQTNRYNAALLAASGALFRGNYGHDHYQLTREQQLGLRRVNAAAWERISSYNDVAKITTLILWMGGGDDWNVPLLNSEQLYLSMKRLRRETQLVVYLDGYHGIKRPSFLQDRMKQYLN
jgi:dipeptidyl aminopeptidase/acylaminoacyl peptidase